MSQDLGFRVQLLPAPRYRICTQLLLPCLHMLPAWLLSILLARHTPADRPQLWPATLHESRLSVLSRPGTACTARSRRLAVDMCMGTVVKFVWQYFFLAGSLIYMVPFAAGIIAGEVRPLLLLACPPANALGWHVSHCCNTIA